MHLSQGLQALWTGEQARTIDSLSIEQHGRSALALMEEAGLALFELCLELRQPFQKFLILAGPGNNGGDALVAARHLQGAGFSPVVWSISAPSSVESPLRAHQRKGCEAVGISLQPFPSAETTALHDDALFVVDGVLGLGLREALRPGFYREALASVAALQPAVVVAVDLPSGLAADAWGESDIPLPAHVTLTFGAPKPAHVLSPARELCGRLYVRSLGFSETAVKAILAKGPQGFSSPQLARHQKPWQNLSRSAHKYTRGHGLVIGGSPGKVGAPLLTAEAALRAGAGWISVAPLSDEQAPVRPKTLTYEHWGLLGSVEEDALERFVLQRKVKGIAIGPGCMDSPLGPSLMTRLAKWSLEGRIFLVFDAGALKSWTQAAQHLSFDPNRTLLTPHPGEWRAIDPLHRDLDSLTATEVAWNFCRSYGVALFYKSSSPFSLWTEGERGLLCTNGDGDQRLARAGSGDLLTGICLALGMSGIPASSVGPLAQSLLAGAVEQASRTQSPGGLTATELLPFLCP